MDADLLHKTLQEQRFGIYGPKILCACGQEIMVYSRDINGDPIFDSQCCDCLMKSIEFLRKMRGIADRAARPHRSEFQSPYIYRSACYFWIQKRRTAKISQIQSKLCRRCLSHPRLEGATWCRECRRFQHELTVRELLTKGSLNEYELHALQNHEQGYDISEELHAEVRKFFLAF